MRDEEIAKQGVTKLFSIITLNTLDRKMKLIEHVGIKILNNSSSIGFLA